MFPYMTDKKEEKKKNKIKEIFCCELQNSHSFSRTRKIQKKKKDHTFFPYQRDDLRRHKQ